MTASRSDVPSFCVHTVAEQTTPRGSFALERIHDLICAAGTCFGQLSSTPVPDTIAKPVVSNTALMTFQGQRILSTCQHRNGHLLVFLSSHSETILHIGVTLGQVSCGIHER